MFHSLLRRAGQAKAGYFRFTFFISLFLLIAMWENTYFIDGTSYPSYWSKVVVYQQVHGSKFFSVTDMHALSNRSISIVLTSWSFSHHDVFQIEEFDVILTSNWGNIDFLNSRLHHFDVLWDLRKSIFPLFDIEITSNSLIWNMSWWLSGSDISIPKNWPVYDASLSLGNNTKVSEIRKKLCAWRRVLSNDVVLQRVL